MDLALHYENGKIQIAEIAKRQDIPLKYLEHIMLILKGAGYVNSRRGPEGGYWLAKEPGEIKLGEIVRLMEGYISPITCVSTTAYEKCKEEKHCVFREVWLDVKNSISNIIDKITFQEMVDRVKEMKKEIPVINYSI